MTHTYNPRTYDTVPEIKTCTDEDKIGISVSGGKDKPVTFVENTGITYRGPNNYNPGRYVYGSRDLFRDEDNNIMKPYEVDVVSIPRLSPDDIHSKVSDGIYYDPYERNLYKCVNDDGDIHITYLTVQGELHIPTIQEIQGNNYWIPKMNIDDVDENTDDGMYIDVFHDCLFYITDSKINWCTPSMWYEIPGGNNYNYEPTDDRELVRYGDIPKTVNDLQGISAYGKIKTIRIVDSDGETIEDLKPNSAGRINLQMPVPPAPDEEGEYTLKVSVDANGYPEYSWVKEEIQNGGATL